jgi:hypothetical protein
MAGLPYITAPGNVEKALNGIKAASTPERVTQDFVKTILKIPGGSGAQVTSFLKKIGFANTDGTPSDIYKKFRNSATSGLAAAQALKIGYAPLYKRNEFMHALKDEELRGLVIEETGAGDNSSVAGLIVAAINAIKQFAKPEDGNVANVKEKEPVVQKNLPVLAEHISNPPIKTTKLGMNLSYTINLNLPATSDIAVFNAIFKSLKENLLIDPDEP